MSGRPIQEMFEGWPPLARMSKRLWHILFDARYIALRRWRPFHFWFAWDAYLGGSVDVDIQFIPAHKARFADEDDDLSWGPELKLGATLLWVSFGLTIPNDDHPANEVKVPPRHCAKCGNETEGIIAQRCTGCGKLAVVCGCDPVGIVDLGGNVDAAAVTAFRLHWDEEMTGGKVTHNADV